MMSTKIYSNFSNDNFNIIAQRIKAGQIIVYPTETVWAIGCISTNKKVLREYIKLKKDLLIYHSSILLIAT